MSGIRISTAVSLLLSAETPSSVEEESSLPRAESDPTPAAPADDIRSIDITPVDNRDEQGINNLLDIDSPLSPEDSSSRNHNCNPNDGVNEANPDMEDPSDGVDPLALGDNEEAVAEGLSIDNIWTVNVEDSPAGEQPPTIEEEQTIMDPTVDSETTASALAVPSLGLRLKNFAVDPTVSVSGDVLPSSVPTVSSSWHTADPSSAQPAPRSPVPIRPLPQQPQRPLQIVTSTVGSPTIMIHHQPSPQPNISMTVQQPPPQNSMAQFYVPDPAPTMQQYLQPAAQQQHQQQFVVPPNVTLPSQPLPVMRPGVPTFTAFKNALDSLEIRTVIKGAQKCACTYMIFSSSENITLRLFIPASKLHVLPQQSEGEISDLSSFIYVGKPIY